GKIARITFSIRHDNLLLRDAADKKTIALCVVCNAFRNQLWIGQAKRHRCIRCSRFIIGEFLVKLLKLRIIPNRFKPEIAKGNEAELAALQSSKQRER